ncbi:CDP-glycerol glycerophosphotransferase family protein [Lactococcus formosensis subsp. bovis]|uniref:CDP-glycerol glycerophosphotransferase family protein n=1 Tax=Lactococcus formosensis TaxID=1281486 RepID=UPI001BCE268D|nr:CDP-glycerol glycerophosphotransferase family protein [Lactococcus formosensis]
MIEVIHQETDVIFENNDIIFKNPQFLQESKLFIRKRGTRKFSQIPTFWEAGELKVKVYFFEELINKESNGVTRYDIYAKRTPESHFEILLSRNEKESNQYEKIFSTNSAHLFVKIYTTLANSLAIASANFSDGIVLTEINEENKTLIFRDFSSSNSGIKWNNKKNVEVKECGNIKIVNFYDAFVKIPFFKEKHFLYTSENGKLIKIKYGLINAHNTISLNSYESLLLKSNAAQDIVKANKITSLNTYNLKITQKLLNVDTQLEEGLKLFIKKRGSKNYKLVQEISNYENIKIEQQKLFSIVEDDLSFCGIYDFFFSNLKEEIYYPFNLSKSLNKVSIYSEGNSIALEYYATKNNNLAFVIKQIASTDVQAALVSYSRDIISYDFKKEITAAELLIVKRKNKSEKYSVVGEREQTFFKFKWGDALDKLGKEQVGAIYDFYIRTTLSNGNQSIHRLANTEEIETDIEGHVEVKDDKQRYLDILNLIEKSDNLHNQAAQLYLTLNNKWSIHKGRAYNLRKTNYKINTKVIGYSEDESSYTVSVLIENQTNSLLDYSQLVLVNRNRLVHIETLLETEKVKIDADKTILTATFSPQEDMSPFYYDLFVLVSDLEKTEKPFYIPVKMIDTAAKDIIEKNVFSHQRFLGKYMMYPYISNLGDLAFEFRLSEKFENKENYIKEIRAQQIAEKLAPQFKNDKIWIVFEKNAQGGHDNGFHFFKYMMENTERKNIYYVIDPLSPEYKNLLPYKDNILEFMSEKYFVYLFLADLLIASDTRYHVYNTHIKSSPLGKALANKPLIYLQHGVNGLKRVPAFHKNSRLLDFICVPDEYEKQMVIEQWGYSEDEVAVTGLARWDSYCDKTHIIPHKQIFIMPTWRKWMDGMSREQFLETPFYKEYSKLLASSTLKRVVLENNARISFFLHPYFKNYVDLFDIDDSFIDKYGYLDVDMGEEIQKSSLMISDYSSVLWDMFYLDKPVIFYQFDQEDYLVSEGTYMDYETELFGDVVFDVEALIQSIREVITNNFEIEDKYKEMRSDYFTYIDQNNSERIYEVVQKLESKSKASNKKNEVSKSKKVKKTVVKKEVTMIEERKKIKGNSVEEKSKTKFSLRVIRKMKRELRKIKKV